MVPAYTPQPRELCVVELLSSISPAVAAFVGRSNICHFEIAARAEPRAPCGNFDVRGHEEVARNSGLLSSFATSAAAELRDVFAELSARGDCDMPAWQLGQRVPPRTESALHGIQLQLQARLRQAPTVPACCRH